MIAISIHHHNWQLVNFGHNYNQLAHNDHDNINAAVSFMVTYFKVEFARDLIVQTPEAALVGLDKCM